jgi:hypothetical protein
MGKGILPQPLPIKEYWYSISVGEVRDRQEVSDISSFFNLFTIKRSLEIHLESYIVSIYYT